MKTIKIAMMLLLTSFVPASFAQSANLAPIIDPNCFDSPEVCQERAQRREELRQRCIADPVWCEERRTRLKREHDEKRELRQQCKATPEQCKTLTKQFRQRKAKREREKRQRRREQRQKLKKAQQRWCEDNPSDCKRWKADFRALQKAYKEKHNQLQDQYPNRPR